MGIKLKDDITFERLIDFGFKEDAVNCEPGDTYYHLNNYYLQVTDEFRITVNMINRHIDILCYAKETGLHNIYDLNVLYDLINNDFIEPIKK